MTLDRWDEIKTLVNSKFQVSDHGIEQLKIDEYNNLDNNAFLEYIIFQGPTGLTKLEFIHSPVVLEKNEIYSKRMGSTSTSKYVYSDTEFSCKLNVYAFKEGEWEKLTSSMFNT